MLGNASDLALASMLSKALNYLTQKILGQTFDRVEKTRSKLSVPTRSGSICRSFNQFPLSESAFDLLYAKLRLYHFHDVIIALEWTPPRASAEHASVAYAPYDVTLMSLAHGTHRVVLSVHHVPVIMND